MDKTTDNRIESRIQQDAFNATEKMKDEKRGASYYLGYEAGYNAGATAEIERLQPVIDALTQFIARHEGGLLPDMFTYEKGVKALEQWNGPGKEITDPCPHCGKELSRDRNLCCRECGKEVGDEG